MYTIDETGGVGLPNIESGGEACCEQESMQGSLPRQDLRDFIQRIIVPILVDRYLGRKKDGERGVGQLQSPNRSAS